MTLSQKTCLSVIINNFGGKWVAQMRTVERLGMHAALPPGTGSGYGSQAARIYSRRYRQRLW
ncbi:hypothetical protein KAM644c_09040 [Klebsiella quasipneumoniae subsp. quasipneumoniae]|uniref:Uncharacterized protein n=1 Tax=Klebsiella quasipneumoniae subsp. quasipneumoniae TaxID=1667327 RepID=A0AAN1Y241_9ENTR|nr:hypothetical protein KAM622c_09140 [Klebsiella quasipneumoniae subsp. quasipneumoniae]BDO11838.1 hypothetical protein KAM644c_09040 [Klebsiella quasipneumoniae subsp. quasipneumoniae]BDO17814.1 hypothetical protein KAM645c_09040 [Klebsiella quasipneumoniae subsp. quasipneumoniae]